MDLLYNILEIAGLLVGVAYLYFEYKARNAVWICGIIMPLMSMWVYLDKGLYADFGINIYYLLAAVYGYAVWKKGATHKTSKPITHIPWSVALLSAMVFAALWFGLYWLLVNCTNSTVPVADSFTTALSIVGMWLMARKYLEQWWAWLIVDATYVGLYIYKELYFYGVLYTIYTVVAVFGYLNWRRLMKSQVTSHG